MKQLILASSSPRRQQLIEKLGIPFVIDPSNFEEYVDVTKSPEDLAIALSIGKAKDIAGRHERSVILAADTFVVLDGQYLNKPKDRQDALEMLRTQSGKKQQVVTGFTILDTESGKMVSRAVVANVYMKRFSDKQINAYLDKDAYLDKAGAYAIQDIGDIFIDRVEGDYDTIVGLPIRHVREILQKEFGYA